MDTVNRSGKTVPSTKVTGVSTKLTATESSGMLTEIFSRVNGKTIRQMAMEFTFTKMEPGMRENGKMIFSTVKAKKSGLIIQCMKDTTTKERNMVRDFIFGRMDPVTMVTGTKIE